jgi:hypothetical protein
MQSLSDSSQSERACVGMREVVTLLEAWTYHVAVDSEDMFDGLEEGVRGP